MTEMIAAVKRYARDHYNEDGWDFVVETLTDAEIENLLTTLDVPSPVLAAVPATPAQAIVKVGWFAGLWHMRRQDIAATAF